VLLDDRKHRRPVAGAGCERSWLYAMHCVAAPCAVDRSCHDGADHFTLVVIGASLDGSEEILRL
jgi:hypothetical protein